MTFDVAPEVYDAFMGRYSTPLAERFAEWAGLPDEGRALDVGYGTGALTRVLARRFGETEVAGVDPSASFVQAAASRFPWADLRRGTAEALPFDDDVFAATLAELVVHFMTDAAAGAREMVRVTRPGGVVAACVWDFTGGRAPQSRFFEALRAIKPDADNETDRFGARQGDLTALLRDVDCLDVVGAELTVSVDFADFEDWWTPYTRGVSPAGAQLAALAPDDKERVRRHAHEIMGDGPFTVEATAWAARGIAP